MDLKYAFEKIMESEELRNKIKKLRLISLVSFLDENENINSWEFNFYDDEKDKINRVIITDKDINYNELLEPAKIDNSKNHINVDNISLDVEEVLDLGHKELSEKYSNEKIQKVFLSLGFDEQNNLTWNISLVTDSLNIINIKVNDISKEVKSESKKVF